MIKDLCNLLPLEDIGTRKLQHTIHVAKGNHTNHITIYNHPRNQQYHQDLTLQ